MIIGIFLLVGYGFFNARDLIMGPNIVLYSPFNESATRKNVALVQGRAKNIVFLSLNDRPISIDTEGYFKDKLLLAPGTNIIRLYGRDRFKQEEVEELRVYYEENNSEEITNY